MTFAEKVKYVRGKLLLSQEDLAKQVGVSFATVNRWEKEIEDGNAETALQVAMKKRNQVFYLASEREIDEAFKTACNLGSAEAFYRYGKIVRGREKEGDLKDGGIGKKLLEKALDLGFPWWTAIVMGTMTGAAGGIFRDVFINVEPLIFRKEIYASACLVGGGAYMFCDLMGCDHIISGIVCGLTVIVVRLLAVKYKLSLPHLRGE